MKISYFQIVKSTISKFKNRFFVFKYGMPGVSLGTKPPLIPSLNFAPFLSFIPSQTTDDVADGDMGVSGTG